MGIAQAPEGRHVFTQMTVYENLLMGAFSRPRQKLDDDIARVFDLFPRLKERRSQKAGTMSGGEQQMLAMGRALMARPTVLLLDEPSMGLSPILTEQIFKIIAEINAQGTTILLVEQNALMALNVAAPRLRAPDRPDHPGRHGREPRRQPAGSPGVPGRDLSRRGRAERATAPQAAGRLSARPAADAHPRRAARHRGRRLDRALATDPAALRRALSSAAARENPVPGPVEHERDAGRRERQPGRLLRERQVADRPQLPAAIGERHRADAGRAAR